MKSMTYPWSQGAQFPPYWASQLSCPGGTRNYISFPNKTVSVHCESSALGHHIFMVLHMCTSLPLNLFASPWGVLCVIPCTLVSLGLPLYKSLNRNPNLPLFLPLMSRACGIHPHYVRSRWVTIPHRKGLGTTVGTQEQSIRANTNLSPTMAKHIRLVHQSGA